MPDQAHSGEASAEKGRWRWSVWASPWRLITSVRWAIFLIAFLAVASLSGVLLPQIPEGVRGDSVAVSAWLESQRDNYGLFTDVLHRLGLFDVFHARWFAVALGLLVVSLAACTARRFPPIWRSIRRPQKRLPDSFFQQAHQRVSFATPADVGALEAVLRRHHYGVERFEEEGSTYLFADRFSWAQLGTFVSHLALILFLVAAVVSKLTGFSQSLFIAEGASASVFPSEHPHPMEVQVIDAVGRFDEQGQPLDYRTEMVIVRDGREVKRCLASVNSPCSYDGYRFHQAAYFGFGAEVQVRHLPSGSVIYKKAVALTETMPAPHLMIRQDGGEPLLDETLVLTDYIESAYGTTLAIPGSGRLVWVGARPYSSGDGWQLVVFEPGDRADPIRLALAQGEKGRSGGLEFEFVSLSGLPASFEPQFPLPAGAAGDAAWGTVLFQMRNAVGAKAAASPGNTLSGGHSVEGQGGDCLECHPAAEASSGDAVTGRAGAERPPTLVIVGLSPYLVSLELGESIVLGDYEYSFLGQREFSGILVKRDHSDNLIWLGAALLLVGLGVTFYVPRRRLWAKIAGDRTYLVGTAGRLVSLRREMGKLAAEAGSPDILGEGKDGSL